MLWNEKVILVTGGTGSFATNFIKYLLEHNRPKAIRVYSRDEHKQTLFLNQYGGIKGGKGNFPIRGFIGDIRDLERLRMAMEGVDIVIHAAALKQVQSCEYNPIETIKTNIYGSQNVIQAALDNNVEKVLAISTDKAVSPLNLYGSTKMVMERLVTNANSYRGSRRTRFSSTRYGNVADSRGTVVHIWKEQIIKGEPVSVTDFEATRFWLTMAEANRFVMECVELMDELDGGEIFAPRLPSVTLRGLYNAIVFPAHPVKVVGNRVGDKLHEDLIRPEEVGHTVLYRGKYVIMPEEPSWPYKMPLGISLNVKNGNGINSGNNDIFLEPNQIMETLNA